MAADVLHESWTVSRPTLRELVVQFRGQALAFVPPASPHAEDVSRAIGALPEVLVALRAIVDAEASRIGMSIFATDPLAVERLRSGQAALEKAGF